MTRQVLLDTETTGLDPALGDRILEIAAIELVNLVPTGRVLHHLLDPEREVPEEATRVHGFTAAMLRGKPKFADILDELLAFLADDPIVAHNAPFDFAFLDAELARCGRPPLDRARMVDTLELAKRRFPGLPNSLDALCRRFGIDLSQRTTHNAVLDCRLLAQVYLELMGGRQPGLGLAAARIAVAAPAAGPAAGGAAPPPARTPRPIVPSEAELAAHAEFVARKLKDALWLKPPFAPAADGE
ncbi:DNA polymerase III subunit epsilon [Caldovatus aquaticus]|uniref:DNA polymerase III subunit epsilon n=1 Tax=Caldovatus aquaticus TaxID=2865671 RepID=A0ABS7F6D7_9PROT|nr:DNA polymerase III subunit epsilon [Caldovatus aquaticus]MBW8271186.1 DNA polymerase III subunit epsilon [Caldovatus aquaticus]